MALFIPQTVVINERSQAKQNFDALKTSVDIQTLHSTGS